MDFFKRNYNFIKFELYIIDDDSDGVGDVVPDYIPDTIAHESFSLYNMNDTVFPEKINIESLEVKAYLKIRYFWK